MFTVKHIRLCGEEDHYHSESARFAPGAPSWESQDEKTGCSETPPTVWLAGKTGQYPLTGGTVFVMNESGKTISRYDLGASPVPIIGDGLSDPRVHGTATSQ